MLSKLKEIFAFRISRKNVKPDRKMLAFAIVAFLVLVEINGAVLYGYISNISLIFDVAIMVLFIAYAIGFVYYKKEKGKSLDTLLKCLFAAVVLTFALHFAFLFIYFQTNLYLLYYIFIFIISGVPFFLPIILFAFLGRSFQEAKVARKYKKGYKIIASVFIATAIILMLFFFLSKYFISGAVTDDEEFLGIQSAMALVNGHNPYTANFSNTLFQNYTNDTTLVPTITTSGSIVGKIDYPAMYFLVSAPFFLFSKLGIYTFRYSGLYIDLAIFALIMVFAVAYAIKYKYLKLPPVILIAFLLLAATLQSSFVDFLMIGLLVIAFFYSKNKYIWVVLGICASIQEELWIPVLLFLIYSFNNYGFKKGIRDLAGTILIFLLINGYFIIAGPSAYFKDVFTPISGYLLPTTYSMMGFLILRIYPILLNSFTFLFIASIAATCLAFLYLNQKRLIFLFSFIPLLFLYHGISPYYDFFIALIIISLYMKDDSLAVSRLKSTIKNISLYRAVMVTAIAAIIFISVIYLVYSHIEYQKIDLYVTNASITTSGNYTIYSAVLHQSNTPFNSVFVGEYSAYKGMSTPDTLGPLTGSMLAINGMNISQSNVSASRTNINIINLNASYSTLDIKLEASGYSDNAIAAQCFLYNGAFFYTCPSATIK